MLPTFTWQVFLAEIFRPASFMYAERTFNAPWRCFFCFFSSRCVDYIYTPSAQASTRTSGVAVHSVTRGIKALLKSMTLSTDSWKYSVQGLRRIRLVLYEHRPTCSPLTRMVKARSHSVISVPLLEDAGESLCLMLFSMVSWRMLYALSTSGVTTVYMRWLYGET